MTIYMNETKNRAIMADSEGNIIAAKGLKNVLCCYSEGLAETEELIPVNLNHEECSKIEWDEQNVYSIERDHWSEWGICNAGDALVCVNDLCRLAHDWCGTIDGLLSQCEFDHVI